jgi:alpha-1,3/alpha-1,6-mannosyltransferase
MSTNPKVVAFIHPDLGIGGAERLILDAARAVKTVHSTSIWTSRYESTRALDDAKDFQVNVRGNWLPRHFFGLFHIIFALLRNLVVTVQCARQSGADIFIVDQISAWLPILKWLRPDAKIIFYCHFPDLLLAPRDSILRRFYRYPFDFLESYGIRKADRILVNSHFTSTKVTDHLHIPKDQLEVLYPCVNCDTTLSYAPIDPPRFLSLNRYERKKNHALAIRALGQIKARTTATLTIAGGYDPQVQENVSHERELQDIANESGVQDRVTYLRNVPDADKPQLIAQSTAVVYTPANEHFGIVPIEALSFGTPVIACNSGGPCETCSVERCQLCPGTPEAFAAAMMSVIGDTVGIEERTDAFKEHAKKFGFGTFTRRWIELINQL